MNQTIVNHGYPEDEEIGVVDMHVNYIQKSDTCSSVETPYQQLHLETVGVEFDQNENTDAFIRMQTGCPEDVDITPYWSINGLEDLVKIFNNFERRRGSTIHYKVTKEVTLPDRTIKTTIYE